MRLLDEHGPMSPSAIAKAMNRRLPTVSGHLAVLRASDLVRYDRRGGRTRYWLKHPRATRCLLGALAAVTRASVRLPD